MSLNANHDGFELSCETNGSKEWTVVKYTGSKIYVFIPKKYKGKAVTKISASAFENCDKVQYLTIPETITEIESGALACCKNLVNIFLDNDEQSVNFSVSDGLLYSKDMTELIACPAKKTIAELSPSLSKIGSFAFKNCTKLTSVKIPNTVTEIGECAFENCTSLAEVTLPNALDRIWSYTFKNCSGLRSVTIPESVTAIGSYAFQGCYSVFDIYYNGSRKMWYAMKKGKGCFSCISPVIHFSDETVQETDSSVKYEGNVLTSCDKEAESFVIAPGTVGIGADAFYGCENLISVTIPDTVAFIGYHAFDGCVNLKGITIPSSVTKISDCAFASCTSLKILNIPDSVEEIGDWAFKDCENLKSVRLPNSLARIGFGVFYNCLSLANVTIPDSVRDICAWAFSGCKSLESINIPHNATSIGEWAFYDCSELKNAVIPQTAVNIGKNAFTGCVNLVSKVRSGSVSVASKPKPKKRRTKKEVTTFFKLSSEDIENIS